MVVRRSRVRVPVPAEVHMEENLSCVKILARNEKFADEDLCHRDYLGALIGLGLKREAIDDLLVEGTKAFVFCSNEIADFIVSELGQVKHTDVDCTKVSPDECDIEPVFDEVKVNVASERVDVVVAGVYNVSRTIAARLITSEYIKIDNVVAKNSGVKLKIGNKVSVRNHGKFIYDGIDGTSKKGRLYVKIRKYV